MSARVGRGPLMPWQKTSDRFRQQVKVADAARDAGDWDRAAHHYESALALRPKAAAIWTQFGHALKEVGNRPRAHLAYAEARTLMPKDPDIHLQIGHLHALQGQSGPATEAYRKAVQLGSHDPHALDYLGKISGILAQTVPVGAGPITGQPLQPGTADLNDFVLTAAAQFLPGAPAGADALASEFRSAARSGAFGPGLSVSLVWLAYWKRAYRIGAAGRLGQIEAAIALTSPDVAEQMLRAYPGEGTVDQNGEAEVIRLLHAIGEPSVPDLARRVSALVPGKAAPDFTNEDVAPLPVLAALIEDEDIRRQIALRLWGKVFGPALLWLVREGWRARPGLRVSVPAALLRRFAEDTVLPAGMDGRLTGKMALIWACDLALQDRFHLRDDAQLLAYARWFRTDAMRELRLAPLASDVECRYMLQAAGPRGPHRLTRFVLGIWTSRRDLRRRFDIETEPGRAGLIGWYAVEGAQEYNAMDLDPGLAKQAR